MLGCQMAKGTPGACREERLESIRREPLRDPADFFVQGTNGSFRGLPLVLVLDEVR